MSLRGRILIVGGLLLVVVWVAWNAASQIILENASQGKISITFLAWAAFVIGAALGAVAVIACLIDFRNVLKRKRTEEALHETEGHWRTYVEQANDLIFALDATGRITTANRALCDALGYAADELIGKSPLEFIAPEARAAAQEMLRQVFQGKNIEQAEIQALTRDQRPILLEVRGRTLRQREQIVGTFHVARDISGRKRAEEMLTAERNLLRTIIDAIPEMIFVKDADGKFLLNNTFHFQTLGVASQADTLSKTVRDFHPPDLADQYTADDQQILKSGQPLIEKEQLAFDHVHGERRWHLVTKVPLRDAQGKIIAVAGVARDITERKRVEEALRASEERHRLLFENSSMGIAYYSPEGRVLAWNKVALAYLNAQPEDVVGKTLSQIFGEQAGEEYTGRVLNAARTPTPQIYEGPVRLPTGDKWFRSIYSQITNAQGKVVGVQVVSDDITELKRVEKALRENEKRYRDLFENANDLIYTHDLAGNFTSINRAAERATGYTRDQALALNVSQVVAPQNLDWVRRVLSPEYLGKGEPVNELEIITKDGRRVPLELSTRLIFQDGKPIGVQGIARDISERKRAEEALNQSLSLLAAAFDSTADGLLVVDLQGKITWTNHKFAEMWHISPEILATRDDDQALAFVLEQLAQPENFIHKVRELYAQPDAESFDILHFKDGRVFERYSQAQRLGEQIVGRVWSFRDVTARHQAEAALKEYSEHLEQRVDARTRELRDAQEQLIRQERLAVLGQLAGGVAHELRSPLTAIKNAAYYFRMVVQNPSPDAREMLDILDQQIDASAHIINSLLDFARPKTPTLQTAQLSHVIDAAICQCTIPQNIAVVWQADERLPSIQIDAEQMQLVFSNLINNAVQAMPSGGKLTIAAQLAGDEMRVTFSDTGVGIPPDALDKVFQPLYTTKAKGIGLGLALCRIIVEAHNGTIGVASQVGQGTTFSVSLPTSAEG